jgi:hypothetical protein
MCVDVVTQKSGIKPIKNRSEKNGVYFTYYLI